ncbi:MAG: nucleotidyltransferase domain-containing protein [Actinomycetota bacterium]
MKNIALKKIEETTWRLLDELKDELKKYWGDQLLTVFVAGSTAHNDFKLNQDVDLLFILNDPLAGEDLPKMEDELKSVWRGGLVADVRPAVPLAMEQAFNDIASKYVDDETDVIVKFVIGPYFPKPTKKLTIHLHIISPMSVSLWRIFTKVYPFHALTMSAKPRVLYGIDPFTITEIKPTLNDIKIWLNVTARRLDGIEDTLKTDPRQATLVISKSILHFCVNTLAYLGTYENNSEQVAEIFKNKILIPLNSLPKLACFYKKHIEEISNDGVKLQNYLNDARSFADQLTNYLVAKQ